MEGYILATELKIPERVYNAIKEDFTDYSRLL